MEKLETPDGQEEFYLGRGPEVDGNRPTFTGDVLETDGGRVLLLQHPCAMRRSGSLASQLLAAPIQPEPSTPLDWHGSYRKMFLPELDGPAQDSSADFANLILINGPEVPSLTRSATLSEVGVAFLMQRWVYHNTRVRVGTRTFIDTLAPQTEEAELETEWLGHYVDGQGTDRVAASASFNAWLDENQRARRNRLVDSAGRAAVRRELRIHLRS